MLDPSFLDSCRKLSATRSCFPPCSALSCGEKNLQADRQPASRIPYWCSNALEDRNHASVPEVTAGRGSADAAEVFNFEISTQPANKYLVLDGQQRLTSLFAAFKGTYGHRTLYIDVLSGSPEGKDPGNEYYDCRFLSSAEALKLTEEARGGVFIRRSSEARRLSLAFSAPYRMVRYSRHRIRLQFRAGRRIPAGRQERRSPIGHLGCSGPLTNRARRLYTESEVVFFPHQLS
jgi:hypothetical protein